MQVVRQTHVLKGGCAVHRIGSGVNEQTFSDMLDAGGFMGIECLETAQRSTSTFTGQWQLFVSDEASENWSQLELFARKEPRVFKTISGLSGFMLDRGFLVTAIPFFKGHRVEISKDGRYRYISR